MAGYHSIQHPPSEIRDDRARGVIVIIVGGVAVSAGRARCQEHDILLVVLRPFIHHTLKMPSSSLSRRHRGRMENALLVQRVHGRRVASATLVSPATTKMFVACWSQKSACKDAMTAAQMNAALGALNSSPVRRKAGDASFAA